MNELNDRVMELSNTLNDSKAQLTVYWTEGRVRERCRVFNELFPLRKSEVASGEMYSIDSVEELDEFIEKYIIHYTRYAKKLVESKIELAQAQMEDYKHF